VRVAKAIRAIEEHGILLVFPITNCPEPKSLWSVLHPRLAMKWAWDDSADSKVGDLWRLRAQLASSGEVVYAKWYQGRATFFSKAVFVAMLARLRSGHDLVATLGRRESELLEVLEESSPSSTKELRATAMTSGLFPKRTAVDMALRSLWERLLVVGVGEVDDGAFPSLSVGATSLLFEPLWLASETTTSTGEALLDATFARSPLMAKQFTRVLSRSAGLVA
jgi:hypothetical protein